MLDRITDETAEQFVSRYSLICKRCMQAVAEFDGFSIFHCEGNPAVACCVGDGFLAVSYDPDSVEASVKLFRGVIETTLQADSNQKGLCDHLADVRFLASNLSDVSLEIHRCRPGDWAGLSIENS
jgi:hypothetical protein